jgi:hypothetical protein
MKDSKKLAHKKILQEYAFVKTDLEYKQSILEENQKDFFNQVYENYQKPENKNEGAACSIKKKKFNWKSLGVDIQEKAKKLYREISKLAHPDKDPNGIYQDVFEKSADAYENGKLMDLYEICDKLGIEYVISDEEIPVIESEISEKRKAIIEIERSIIYIWSQLEGDEKTRKELVDQFIEKTKNKL